MDDSASLHTLRKRSMQVMHHLGAMKVSLLLFRLIFSLVGSDLSLEFTNEGGLERGDVEGIGYQDLVSVSS